MGECTDEDCLITKVTGVDSGQEEVEGWKIVQASEQLRSSEIIDPVFPKLPGGFGGGSENLVLIKNM